MTNFYGISNNHDDVWQQIFQKNAVLMLELRTFQQELIVRALLQLAVLILLPRVRLLR